MQHHITANTAYYGLCGGPHNPYIEMYADQNGRIVLELEPDQVQVIGTPIPASESEPVSREEQNRNMAEFLVQMAREVRL